MTQRCISLPPQTERRVKEMAGYSGRSVSSMISELINRGIRGDEDSTALLVTLSRLETRLLELEKAADKINKNVIKAHKATMTALADEEEDTDLVVSVDDDETQTN